MKKQEALSLGLHLQPSGFIVMPDLGQTTGFSTRFPVVVLSPDREENPSLVPYISIAKDQKAHMLRVYQAEFLASMGYIVLVPDLFGFSEHADRRAPVIESSCFSAQYAEKIFEIIDHVLNKNASDNIFTYWDGRIAFIGSQAFIGELNTTTLIEKIGATGPIGLVPSDCSPGLSNCSMINQDSIHLLRTVIQ